MIDYTQSSIPNPFDGILPDFTIFGAEFTEVWQKLLAGAWGIALVIAAFFLIAGGIRLAKSSNNPNERADARTQVGWSLAGIAFLAAVAVVFFAVTNVVG